MNWDFNAIVEAFDFVSNRSRLRADLYEESSSLRSTKCTQPQLKSKLIPIEISRTSRFRLRMISVPSRNELKLFKKFTLPHAYQASTGESVLKDLRNYFSCTALKHKIYITSKLVSLQLFAKICISYIFIYSLIPIQADKRPLMSHYKAIL